MSRQPLCDVWTGNRLAHRWTASPLRGYPDFGGVLRYSEAQARFLINKGTRVILIRVAAAVLNQTPLAWDDNAQNIRRAMTAAREAGVSVLCLPELCLTGYGCEDAFHAPGVVNTAWATLQQLVSETSSLIVSFGLPLRYRGGVFNGAALAVDGALIGVVCKQNLAGEGLHYEPRWFKPWPNDVQVTLQRDGQSWPLGDLIFDCGGVRIGFEICEDAWVLDRPGSELAQQGVDILLNPSASHFAFGKHKVRKRIVLNGSRAFYTTYVYANLLGNEAGRIIYDGDAMIASCGQLIASGDRFSYDQVELTSAVIDVEATRMQRARSSSFPVDVQTEASRRVEVPFEFPAVAPGNDPPKTPQWENGEHVKQEEFTRAISLGLFDYLRKSRSRGFVVSLSGGADSAAVAVLVARMVRLARSQLGDQGLQQRLAYIDGLASCTTESDYVQQLLTCVYQSTRNSSDTTRDAAAAVAGAVGATFIQLDVDSLVEDYVQIVSDAMHRDLDWGTDDLALQNIQARVRGPSVWMLANVTGALLLATSNRSEAAVGYATMDGDTCGGLSPIAGIDKAFLCQWLQWMESQGPQGVGALPELARVNAQQPTAELRPPDAGQTDEADLMPYEVLDAIERSAIRDKQMPRDVMLRIQAGFPDHHRHQILGWVEKFFRLWCRNQWKRERYAPSFHVDDENLDPKTWCRFPILSGGFERELRLLREEFGAEP